MGEATRFKAVPTTITKGGAPRQFTFRISDGTADRDNDVIDVRGWQLDDYRRNAVVLLNHDRSALPVARCVDIGVMNGALMATAQFPPVGLYPVADTVHDLVANKYVNAASVGFIPIRYEINASRGGLDFLEQTLLEWSIVSIPANAGALVQARSLTANTAAVLKFLGTRDDSIVLDVTDWSPSRQTRDEIGLDQREIGRLFAEVVTSQLKTVLPGLVSTEVDRAIRRVRGRAVDEPWASVHGSRR